MLNALDRKDGAGIGNPDSGTILSIKGVQQGAPMKGDQLFNALIRAWLGPKPADPNLKDALLGKAP